MQRHKKTNLTKEGKLHNTYINFKKFSEYSERTWPFEKKTSGSPLWLHPARKPSTAQQPRNQEFRAGY